MKVLSWNCRGGRGTPSIRHINSLLYSTTPEILFVSETRSSAVVSERNLKKLSLPNSHFEPSVGLSGGLWLLWSSQLQVQIVHSSKHFIIAEVDEGFPKSPWILVGVYGPAKRKDRKDCWNELANKATSFTLPWCCIGDFNAILKAAEKSGGSPVTEALLADFKRFVYDTGLMDLGYSGPAYTWSNKRQRRFNIRERLDRALVDHSWRILHQKAEVLHLPAIGSDHCPILLLTDGHTKRFKAPFRFESMLLNFNSFKQFVSAKWPLTNPNGSITEKCSTLQKSIKQWKRKHLGDWNTNISNLKNRILHLQMSPPTDENILEEKKVQKELQLLLKVEEDHWHQRSRSNWIQAGDRNTKYFHLYTMNRKQKNKIIGITTEDGDFTDDTNKIKGVFLDYFVNLFKTSHPCAILSAISFDEVLITTEENQVFQCCPSEEEIKNVVFNLHPTKAPGPDGYSAIFYQKFWSVLRLEMMDLVHNFFNSKEMPLGVNHSFIALIPKKKDCRSPQDFRPISLSNVTYKIIAKILATRFKSLIQRIISPYQSAFLAGRNIGDNLIIAREVSHFMRQQKGRSAYFILKLDMSKAFDRLEWPFIEAMLQKIGMDGASRQLLMECVTSTSFSVIINGEPGATFMAERGIRQGCPLSPFFFVLAMEALSKQIQAAIGLGVINGIQISRTSPTISHLLFADDVLLFGEASMSEIRMYRAILHTFSRMTGQQINFSKSSIYFSPNCNPALADSIRRYLGVGIMNSDDPYLGARIFSGHPQRRFIQNIIAKTNTRLKGWKAKCISQAGRTILLKSSLASLPVYAMCTSAFPQNTCQQLDAIQRDFWWGFDRNKRNLYLKSWKTMQKPKKFGGLGIRSMQLTNKALLLKLAWRFCTEPDALWVQLLSSKYIRSTDFWGATEKSTSSATWKAILGVRPYLFKNSTWLVGKGDKINIWRDQWVRNYHHVLTPKTLDYWTPHMVAELIDMTTHSWRADIIHKYFTEEAAIAILNTPLGKDQDEEDMLVWTGTRCGRFTTRSAHDLLSIDIGGYDPAVLDEGSDTNCLLGSTGLAPRVVIFLWRCLQGAIPVKDSLHSRGITPDNTCFRCGVQAETIDHLLLHCTKSREVWQLVNINIPDNLSSFGSWLAETKKGSKLKFAQAGTTAWFIWKARCDMHFKSLPWQPSSIANRASIFFNQYWKPKDQSHAADMEMQHITKWTTPKHGWLKANVDGSASLEASAAAVVVRNSNNEHLISMGKYFPPKDPIEAEVKAYLMAFDMSISNGWDKVIIEGDSLIISRLLLHHEIQPPWSIQQEISHARMLMRQHPNFQINHISRCANVAAHKLANFCRASKLNFFALDNEVPGCISDVLAS